MTQQGMGTTFHKSDFETQVLLKSLYQEQQQDLSLQRQLGGRLQENIKIFRNEMVTTWNCSLAPPQPAPTTFNPIEEEDAINFGMCQQSILRERNPRVNSPIVAVHVG